MKRPSATRAHAVVSVAPPRPREEVVWQGTEGLTRRLIYSHHIIAPSKRAGLRECAQILGVTTLVKIGWPGAICLEGPKDRVDAFVNHITRWRWKQLAVRGEQDAESVRSHLPRDPDSRLAGHLAAGCSVSPPRNPVNLLELGRRPPRRRSRVFPSSASKMAASGTLPNRLVGAVDGLRDLAQRLGPCFISGAFERQPSDQGRRLLAGLVEARLVLPQLPPEVAPC